MAALTAAATRFNTQPPEGGWKKVSISFSTCKVSTHSRPKAAGYSVHGDAARSGVSTHSRPKAAGQPLESDSRVSIMFQHTAARRRLGPQQQRQNLQQ